MGNFIFHKMIKFLIFSKFLVSANVNFMFQCDPKFITVILPTFQFDDDFPVEKLSLNSRECTGILVDDAPREIYIVFNITDSLTSCGTEIVSNETRVSP